MKEGIYSKFHQPVYFTLNDQETSSIRYNEVSLYYTKFKQQPFYALTNQYKGLKHEEMVIDFNGLIIKPKVPIEDIIQSFEQQRVFQYVINRSHLPELVIPKKWCMVFNRLISKIMKSGMYSQIDMIQQIKNLVEKYEDNIQVKSINKSENQAKQDQHTDLKMLIYWVDDEPQNNLELIKKYLNSQKIQVKQITSTEEMMQYIEVQYELQKTLGRSILVISDMARLQKGKMNYQAGIDLFQFIYHNKKLDVPGIAFVNNKQKTIENMDKRKLKRDHLKVLNDATQLLTQIRGVLLSHLKNE